MAVAFALVLGGCDQDTAEKTGKQIGRAAKQLENKVDEAGEALKKGAQKFKEGYREAG